jgi:hypothetical protein
LYLAVPLFEDINKEVEFLVLMKERMAIEFLKFEVRILLSVK